MTSKIKTADAVMRARITASAVALSAIAMSMSACAYSAHPSVDYQDWIDATAHILNRPVVHTADGYEIAYYSGTVEARPDPYVVASSLAALSATADRNQVAQAHAFLRENLSAEALEDSISGYIYAAEAVARANRHRPFLDPQRIEQLRNDLASAANSEADGVTDVIDLHILATALRLLGADTTRLGLTERFEQVNTCDSGLTELLYGESTALTLHVDDRNLCRTPRELWGQASLALRSSIVDDDVMLSASDCELLKATTRLANVYDDAPKSDLLPVLKAAEAQLKSERTDAPLICLTAAQETASLLAQKRPSPTAAQEELLLWKIAGGAPPVTHSLNDESMAALQRIAEAAGVRRPPSDGEKAWLSTAAGRLASRPDAKSGRPDRTAVAEAVSTLTDGKRAVGHAYPAIATLRAAGKSACDASTALAVREAISDSHSREALRGVALSYLQMCSHNGYTSEISYLVAAAKKLTSNPQSLDIGTLWSAQAVLCALAPDAIIARNDLWDTIGPKVAPTGGIADAVDALDLVRTRKTIDLMSADAGECKQYGSMLMVPVRVRGVDR